jgi:Flp pilus assembly pilin Flp
MGRYSIRFRRSLDNERGTAMMEYALLAACIAVFAIGGMSFLGDRTKKTFNTAGSQMSGGGIIPPPDDEEVPW